MNVCSSSGLADSRFCFHNGPTFSAPHSLLQASFASMMCRHPCCFELDCFNTQREGEGDRARESALT